MVDFGTLTQPQTDTQSNKYLNFDVTATELKLNDNNFVSVSTLHRKTQPTRSKLSMIFIRKK